MRSLSAIVLAVLLPCVVVLVPAMVLGQSEALTAFTVTAPAAGPNLAPFAAGPEDLIFGGERQRRDLVFVAQPEQTASPATLVLTLQSAVSDAPEASHVALALNGRDLGTMPLRAGAPYSLRLKLPAGLVQPGYNALRMTVDQAHRVDCSIAATYELWTRIDPLLSGVEFASAATAGVDFGSILALSRAASGTVRIRGRLIAGSADFPSDQLLKAISALTIGAAFDRPEVEFDKGPGAGEGVDILVGTTERVAAALHADGIAPVLHPGVNVARADTGKRLVLAIVGTDADDLDAQIAGLAQSSAGGTPEGLAAVSALRGIDAGIGGKLAFTELGIDDRTFSGRRYSGSAVLRMPSDFYPADYERAGLFLDAHYATGLEAGAELLVKLNGQTVSTIVLSGSRTGEIREQKLPISMSAFRPGLNTMTIEASLPTAGDATCDPGYVAQGGGRLRISGASYLELPEVARVGRFPDLAAIDTSITGHSPDPLNIVVKASDRAAMNAAGTLLAKLAYSSQRLIDAHLVSSTQFDPAAPTLLIGDYASLPIDLLDGFDIDMGGIAPATVADQLPGDFGPPADDWVAQWRAYAAGFIQRVADRTRGALGEVSAAVYGLGASLGVDLAVLRDVGDRNGGFTAEAGSALVIAQRVNAAGTAPITLVAATPGYGIEAGVSALVGDSAWHKLAGATATIDKSGQVLQFVPARGTILFATQPPSFGNGRLVFAGWLSNNPIVYLGLLLVFALLLGIATSTVLRRSRKRTL